MIFLDKRKQQMKFSNEVWVFIEQRDGKPADVSFELTCKAHKLAQTMNGTVKAVVIGDNVEGIAKETFRYGADEVLMIDHPSLRYFRTIPYSRVFTKLIEEFTPRIVLF